MFASRRSPSSFGTNSSGKSSLGQILLVLKQTAESTDRSQVLQTGDDNTPANVGDYSDLIHRHDESRDLAFEIGWRQERPLEVEDAKDPEVVHSSSAVTFDCEIFHPPSGRERMRVRRFAYSFGDDAEAAGFSAGMKPDPRRASRYRLDFEGFTPVHNRGRAWELPPPSRFYGFPDEAVAYFQNTDFLLDLSLALDECSQRSVIWALCASTRSGRTTGLAARPQTSESRVNRPFKPSWERRTAA